VGASVLVIEDDLTVSQVATAYLEREGFDVERLPEGRRALERIRSAPPDVVVLDVMLPGPDGFELCRRMRASTTIPIVMLTARGAEGDCIRGLELGADDYVTKPFSPRELTARVKSVLRRTARTSPPAQADARLVAGELAVERTARRVLLAGEPVSLTPREYELLLCLMLHPGRAFRREELLEQVWGYTFGDAAVVTVTVSRLREKVERVPTNPAHLKTVWGVGYRFDP
jgi:two-component system response regulator ResD